MSAWDPDLTPSFKPEEMACRCGRCIGHALMHARFMQRLQAMRDRVGPIVVTSGYRCPDHPAERRKEKPGAHAQGRAADLLCRDAGPRFRLIEAALAVGMTGIGVASGFIHVDDRHAHMPRPAFWRYE